MKKTYRLTGDNPIFKMVILYNQEIHTNKTANGNIFKCQIPLKCKSIHKNKIKHTIKIYIYIGEKTLNVVRGLKGKGHSYP